MPIKLSDALQGMKARIADLESINPSFDLQPVVSEIETRQPASFAAAPPNFGTSSSAVLKLSQIVVAPDRIRQYFDGEKTASLVQSIQRYGFRGLLWVRLIQGRYHLVAGGRRYVACQQAGIQEVPVEIWQITDAEAIQLELLENFQREDLNPIEETEGILRMLEVTLSLPRTEIIALLNRRSRQQREAAANIGVRDIALGSEINAETGFEEPPSTWQTIEDLFNVIGRFSPESFRTHRLPLLSLPQPLIAAIQTGQMEYSKARLIARIRDAEARAELLNQAISANWSRQQITQQIQERSAAAKPEAKPQTEQAQLKARAKAVLKQLEATALSGRSLKKAGKLLAELEALLSQQEI